MTQLSVPELEKTNAWKAISKQSERQLGAFIAAHLLLTKRSPALLNPNNEVRLRNDVIHGGYVPTFEEAAAFGNSVMTLINQARDDLRKTVPEALKATYESLSPAPKDKSRDDELQGVVNVLTAVDVRHPAVKGDDPRLGGVENQFPRILRNRQPHKMELFSDKDEMKKHSM